MRNRIHGIAVALVMIASASDPALAQAPGQRGADEPASVAGVVTNSITGEPVLRAHITLQNYTPGREGRYGAMTGADGKFSITSLAPGTYMVSAERTGFAMETARGGMSKPIMLRSGEKAGDVKLELIPCGAIAGRVLDDQGAPMEFIQVRVQPTGSVSRTDEDGSFRIGGLPPGRYRVSAIPLRRSIPPEIRTDGTIESYFAPTFYPNSLTPRSAARVRVQAASETSGIEIRLIRAPILRVSGRVLNVPPGPRGTSLQIFRGMQMSGSAVVRPDGSFEIWRLPPGKYTMAALTPTPAGQPLRTAPAEIEVANANIDDVVLTFGPPINLAGRLEEEEQTVTAPPSQTRPDGGQPEVRTRNRQFVLRSVGGLPSAVQVRVAPDGSFEAKNVPPGRYRVNLGWGPAYVKSIRTASTETAGALVDLRQASGDVRITVATGSSMGEVYGSVRGETDPAPDTMVAALPAASLEESYDVLAYSSLARVQPDGTYSLKRLPPGNYRLLAADPSEINSLRQAGSVEDYEEFLETVEVRAGEKTMKDLRRYAADPR